LLRQFRRHVEWLIEAPQSFNQFFCDYSIHPFAPDRSERSAAGRQCDIK
jgi:hypothetical protein